MLYTYHHNGIINLRGTHVRNALLKDTGVHF